MADPRPHSILIVDDDAVSREVMAMMLEMHGYAVTSAEDGAAAVAALQALRTQDSAPPDLVLMDAQMPGLNGAELIAALRAAGASRVVAISASDPGEPIRTAADGFLLKPVGPGAVAVLFSAPAAPAEEETAAPDSPLGSAAVEHVVEPGTLAKFRAMMPASAVCEIYAATAADMKTRLAALESAVTAGDSAEVSRIAHSIKGSCAMVGMTGGRNAAARLETGGLDGTERAEITQLHIALAALEVMLASDFPA